MRVLDPGHEYEVDIIRISRGAGPDQEGYYDHPLLRRIVFVKHEGEKYPGNVGHHKGTQTQELIRVCIDRTAYLNGQADRLRAS